MSHRPFTPGTTASLRSWPGRVPASVVQLWSHYGCSPCLAATVPAVRPIPRVGELPPPEGGDPPQSGSVLAFATCRTNNVDLLLSAPAARAMSKARLDSGDWTEVLAAVPFEQSVDVTPLILSPGGVCLDSVLHWWLSPDCAPWVGERGLACISSEELPTT